MKPSPIAFKSIPGLQELRASFPGLEALFFDMDGTLFNTESYHAEALFAIAGKYNIRPPHSPEVVRDLLLGKADHLVWDIIKDWEGVPREWSAKEFIQEKNALLIEILSRIDSTEYFPPAVRSLLHETHEARLFMALVTSSEKVITETLLDIAGIRNLFQLILTRDDCPTHKPDPWPYLKAMEIAAVDKKSILIFEDSQVGLSAALDAGPHVAKVEWFE